MADTIVLDREEAKILRDGLGRLPTYGDNDKHKMVMMLYARLDRVITGERRGLRKSFRL
jgi:hypothetical protein